MGLGPRPHCARRVRAAGAWGKGGGGLGGCRVLLWAAKQIHPWHSWLPNVCGSGCTRFTEDGCTTTRRAWGGATGVKGLASRQPSPSALLTGLTAATLQPLTVTCGRATSPSFRYRSLGRCGSQLSPEKRVARVCSANSSRLGSTAKGHVRNKSVMPSSVKHSSFSRVNFAADVGQGDMSTSTPLQVTTRVWHRVMSDNVPRVQQAGPGGAWQNAETG